MKILFQGDSITDGNRYKDPAQEWDKNHQIGHSYVYTIVSYLGMMFPERHYEFINRGISGNRTDHLLARWEEDTLAYKPDVLCLLCGTNDSFYPMDDEFDQSEPSAVLQRYEKLLQMTKAACPNTRIVLLEPFHGSPKANNVRVDLAVGHSRLAGIQQGVAILAEKYDAIFIPLQDVFDRAAKQREMLYWIWDGIHPTEPGHGLIAKEFFAHTKDLFGVDPDLWSK